MLSKGILPEKRRGLLKSLLQANHTKNQRAIRIMEVHNGLSAMIANDARLPPDANGETKEFDGLWVSGLTESAARGLPDIELQGLLSRVHEIQEIVGVSHKPILVDGDTGGTLDQLQYYVRTMEALGVSALIIEDKVFPKNNSLDFNKPQVLEQPEIFARKIKAAKEAQKSEDFMLVARIEALVAGKEMGDALLRAETYLQAGADAIVIHSRMKQPNEVLEFAKGYTEICKRLGKRVPLISIPTLYNTITEEDLYQAGFNLVIHANYLLRSACLAMQKTAQSILKHGRSHEVEPDCVSLPSLFDTIEKSRNEGSKT